mmetsp:Transcript_8427/g.17129  ORF Transcript_8427/g.17129 Transcript_8427/m.17129 type:complete len:342 (+) Transcript_8427:491-1516(+)
MTEVVELRSRSGAGQLEWGNLPEWGLEDKTGSRVGVDRRSVGSLGAVDPFTGLAWSDRTSQGTPSLGEISRASASGTSEYILRLRRSRRISSRMIRRRSLLSLSDDDEDRYSPFGGGSGSRGEQFSSGEHSDTIFIPDVLPKLERLRYEERQKQASFTRAVPVSPDLAGRLVVGAADVEPQLSLEPLPETELEDPGTSEPPAMLIQYGMKGTLLQRKIQRELESQPGAQPQAFQGAAVQPPTLSAQLFRERLHRVRERMESLDRLRGQGAVPLANSANYKPSPEIAQMTVQQANPHRVQQPHMNKIPDRIVRFKEETFYEKETNFVLVWDAGQQLWILATL